MSVSQNVLIARAKLGSAKAVETLSKIFVKDAALFRRIIPILFKHLHQNPPSFEGKAVVGGYAPALDSVELAIRCIDALNQGFEAFSLKVLDGLIGGPNRKDRITAEWPAIRGWIMFFVRCLDFHRQATVLSEYQDQWLVATHVHTHVLEFRYALVAHRRLQ
ncbi:hypothetical protein C8J56DRAFT_1162447 [Mycena floridula]|nr:hypothetical protein C8J56DRAFT_1162447 [Mycena floridula]